MATYQDGNKRTATANTVASMRRQAERRKCPSCGRKSAIVSWAEDWGNGPVFLRVCRWKEQGLCDYEQVREP